MRHHNLSFLWLLFACILFSSNNQISSVSASSSVSIRHNPLKSIRDSDGKLSKSAKAKLHSRFKSSSRSSLSPSASRSTSSKSSLQDRRFLPPSSSLRSREDQRKRVDLSNQARKEKEKETSQNGIKDRGLISGLVGGIVETVRGVVRDSLDWREDKGWGIAIAETENDEIDNEWLVDVGFGSPEQRLSVVLDTGSPLAWIYSDSCCYSSNHSFFDHNKSRSYHNRTIDSNGTAVPAKSKKTPGQAWNITYGGGSSSGGYLGYDRVVFGEEGSEIKLNSQSFGLTTEITGNSRSEREMEGIIGMSPGSSAGVEGGWITPFENMVKNNLLEKPYFSATFIKADRRTGKDGGGRYIFGDLDHESIEGEMIWIDSVSQSYWGGLFDSMKMTKQNQSQSVQVDSEISLKRFILDTGSALLNVPTSIAKAANDAIYGSYLPNQDVGWLVPCKTGLEEYENSLEENQRNPDFYFGVGGSQFKIPSQDFVFYPLEPVSLEESDGREDMCVSAFQIGPEAFSVIGASLIKNTAVTFDLGDSKSSSNTRRVGFANRTLSSLTI